MTDVEWEAEESDDDVDDDLMYLKYMFEGASALAELSAALRGLADDCDARAIEGWTLARPVDGGWAHIVPPTQGENRRQAQ